MNGTNCTIVGVAEESGVTSRGTPRRILTCSLDIRMDDGREVRIHNQPFEYLGIGQRVAIDIDLEPKVST
jgi:hypothetical protein